MPAERLDVRVARDAGVTRSRADRLIRDGMVACNGKVETKSGAKVADTDMVVVTVPPPAPVEAQPENLPLEILYEDAHLAVVNKPAGMVVHPAAGNETGTLVNALLFHLKDLSGIGGAMRPGIVHRLDKDTSGLLLVAKTDAAHQALSDALKAREIHKTYRAIAFGRFKEETGVIEKPIARHPVDRKRMAIVEGGRYARTEYRVVQELHGATLLDVDLITGRTHQIRVHFTSIGHPLLGDPIYGGDKLKPAVPRLMLHAGQVAFIHPATQASMQFTADVPEDFSGVVHRLSRP